MSHLNLTSWAPRLLILGIGLGQGMAYADAAESLIARLEAMQTFSATLAEQIVNETGDILRNSQGEIFIERPHKLLWQTFEPFPITVLAKDESVYIYDQDLAQVTELELEEVLGTTPAGIILTAGESLGEEFLVSEAFLRDQEGQVYSLQPLAEDAEFSRMDISFDEIGLRGLFVEDVLGQTTYVSFRDRETNVDIDDARFEIEFPEGIDWVKR